ncbi:MAG: RND family transporter [Acidimicrobiales bacterium]
MTQSRGATGKHWSPMNRFWTWIAVNFGKHMPTVVAVGLLVTLVLGVGLRNLEFATGQDSYLNKDQQVYKDNKEYQSLFGGDAMVVMLTAQPGHTIADLATAPNRAAQQKATAQLKASGQIYTVVTPLDALDFTQSLVKAPPGGAPTDSVGAKILLGAIARDPNPASKQARLTDSTLTLVRLSAAGAETYDNPAWVQFLLYDNSGFSVGPGGTVVAPPAAQLHIRKALAPFFPNQTHALIVARLGGNLPITKEGKGAVAVVDTMNQTHLDGFTILTTGYPVVLKNINDYLQGGFLGLGAIAVGVMALILILLFNVRWRLLPLAVVIIGVIWAFGVFGFFSIPLSLVTISGLPILIGLGIDFSIQMHNRIEEEVVIDRSVHPIAETTTNLAPALLTATAAAVISFAALQFSHVPMIRQFGILLIVGIIVIWVASVILPTAVLGFREFHSRTATGDYREGALGKLVVWLGSLPQAAVVPLVVGSVVILALGVAVEGRLKLQTDPKKWVNQHTAVIRDLNTLQTGVGTTSELGIFVQSATPFSDAAVQYTDSFARKQLAEHPAYLLDASSMVTTVSYLIDLPEPPLGVAPVQPTGADVEAAYKVAPADIQKGTVANDGRALNLIFQTRPTALVQESRDQAKIRVSLPPPPGVTATPAGLAVVGVGLLANLEANRAALTYIALGLVFLFLLLRFRSLGKGVMSMVPVLIAVGASALVEFAAGLQLSPLTVVGGPLVIAICTEFTALILLRYMEERERGEEPQAAIHVVASRTGRAFFCSALTAISGIAVLALSSLPLLRDFGIIVGLNVSIALLSALVVLPPLLVWADTRGLLKGGPKAHREPAFDGEYPEPGSRAAAKEAAATPTPVS